MKQLEYEQSLIKDEAQNKCNDNDNFQEDANSNIPLDTVGAIVLDSNGQFASAVSSGGILLKHPGRIGHASIYGCGCWVDEAADQSSKIAVCTTGCGEHILKTIFAKECADAMLDKSTDAQSLNDIFNSKFFNSSKLKVFKEKLIGALITKLEKSDNNEYVELYAAHSTSSMCYGFMSSNMKCPSSVMSRLPNNDIKNKININSHRIKLFDQKSSSPNHEEDNENSMEDKIIDDN